MKENRIKDKSLNIDIVKKVKEIKVEIQNILSQTRMLDNNFGELIKENSDFARNLITLRILYKKSSKILKKQIISLAEQLSSVRTLEQYEHILFRIYESQKALIKTKDLYKQIYKVYKDDIDLFPPTIQNQR